MSCVFHCCPLETKKKHRIRLLGKLDTNTCISALKNRECVNITNGAWLNLSYSATKSNLSCILSYLPNSWQHWARGRQQVRCFCMPAGKKMVELQYVQFWPYHLCWRYYQHMWPHISEEGGNFTYSLTWRLTIRRFLVSFCEQHFFPTFWFIDSVCCINTNVVLTGNAVGSSLLALWRKIF